MKQILCTLIITLFALCGCGTDPVFAQGTQPTAFSDTVFISKPASLTDAYNGGLNITRNTSTLVDAGAANHVNVALFNHSIAGVGVNQFEWASLNLLDNYANHGENVAAYAQANRQGQGPTWAAVSEVADFSQVGGGVVAHEFDVWTRGPDTGSRIGLDVVLGDLYVVRGLGVAASVVEGSVGLRIGNSNGGSIPRWTRGIQLTGNYIVGQDFSTSNTQTAIRLKAGQTIALDGNDGVTLSLTNSRVTLKSFGKAFFEVDTATGDVYKNGSKVY